MPRKQITSRRAPKGQGSVTKRVVIKNGKRYEYWQARLSIIDPSSGKRKQLSFSAKTQKEAVQKLNKAQNETICGSYIDPTKLTVKEWLNVFQKDYMTDCTNSTKYTYMVAINNYIIPAIGGLKLQSLSAPQVQSFANSLSKKGLAPKTVKNYHGTLARALSQALQIGYIKVNPAQYTKLPKAVRKEVKALDADGVFKLLEGLKGHRFEVPITVCIFTGMRECELTGLQWRNVDFENCTITVDHQYQRNKYTAQYEILPTKTGNIRVISVPQSIMDLLQQERKKQLTNAAKAGCLWKNDNNFVFTDELGNVISDKALYNSFKRTLKQIDGVPDDLCIHSLRHTFATISLQLGTDYKTVQESLGHTQASTTINIYSHSTDAMKKEAANKMERLIQKVSNG